MADLTDDVGTNTQTTRNVLLKRNPHLRGTDTSSPSFGGLGTRQFLQKQLMTPGSATSASSFEEGASYDGFSDAGTPASEETKSGTVQHSNLYVKTEPSEYVTRTVSKQPTKRLSSPSRESLARRLMGTSTKTHGMLLDEESMSKVDMMEGEINNLPPSEMLSNLVVKNVPSIEIGGESSTSTTMIPLSPRSTKITRRIVASPRKTMRRVVVRRTGTDGKVHEEVQYVDADGQVVQQGGNFFNGEGEETSLTSSGRTTVTRRISTPAQTVRRVVVRRTGAGGQVHEEVQYLDVDGKVVQTEGGDVTVSDSVASSSVVTRKTVTPGKTVRRVIVRKTGADGQMHEEVQFMDADGNVVQTDGSALVKTNSFTTMSAPGSSFGRTTVTRRIMSPGQKLKRVLIRKKGVDGKVHEEVQHVDADGNVVSTEGGDLSKTEETITHEGSSDASGRTKVTRRVIRRMLFRKDGTSVPVEQYVDSDGNVIEGEGGALVSTGSFTGSISSVTSDTAPGSNRSVVTRRVVASPVRRSVVHKAGSSSGAESEEDVQYLDSEDDLAISRTVITQSTPGRRIITHRVVTPQRAVRRMVTRKGTAGSGTEADVDDLDIDAEFVQSEGSASSDESVGGSSRGGYTVSNRIVIPGSETRRIVPRSVTSSNHENVASETDASPNKNLVTTTNQREEVTNPTRVVTETQEGAESSEATQKVGVTPGVIWDYFNKSEDEDKPVSSPAEVSKNLVSSNDEEDKAPIPTTEVVTRSTHNDEQDVSSPIVAATIVDDKSPVSEVEATELNEEKISVLSVDEPAKTLNKKVAASKDSEHPHAGGFWNFIGKSEENNVDGPSSSEKGSTPSKKPIEEQVVPRSSSEELIEPPRDVLVATEVEQKAQQHPDTEDEAFETPQTSRNIDEALGVDEEKNLTAAAIVDTVDDTVKPTDSDVVPSHDNVVVTTTTTTEEVVEESQGGFWGFFGKSEPMKPRTADVPSETHSVEVKKVVDVSEDAAPVTSTPVVDVSASPSSTTRNSLVTSEVQQDLPVSHEGEIKTATVYEDNVPVTSDEEKTPIVAVEAVQADVIDVPESQQATETVDSLEASSKSPRGNRTPAVVGAAGLATAAVVHALDSNKPDTQPAEEEVANVTASSVPHPVVTTTVTTEEFESPSTVPHRKTGRSIWKFWGTDKPKSPLSEYEKPKDDAGTAIALDAAVPSAGEALQYWQQQDLQNSTQISYAAAEGAKYGPESKFEPMSATDKIRSPAGRSQAAVVEENVQPNVGGIVVTEDTQTTVEVEEENVQPNVGGIVVTEDTQTTVEVEEEIDSGRIYHDAAAPDADIAVVTESQHHIERESVEREEPKAVKPARAGGFWSFLNKKDKPEEPAAAAGVERMSWAIEGESESIQHTEEATAVVQVEAVRRSIQPDSTPTNVAGPVASSGKVVRESERRTTELIDSVEPDVEIDEHYVEIASPRHGGRALNDEGLWTAKPCSLSWNNLRLNWKNWKSAPVGSTPDSLNANLLDNGNGSVKAGEFLVITGPSKDESLALLSCLAGYEDAMEGNVTVNGREWNEKMNRYISYVRREDLFYETLTVQEHLAIQAQLRMRRTHTNEMCLERVERVIEDMELSDCRYKLIGGGISLRGITRGERKLLAFATALLTNPSILLVEEPTDGLDTFSAEEIVAKLRWLAFEKKLTVAVTLHHPSSHFYGLFDVLYLVADASCVYDGKASDAVAYFSTIGYQCPEYMSPMDYFMLQLVIGDRESDDEGVARIDTLKREWSERNAAVYADNAARAASASEDAVVDDYDQKNNYYHMGCCDQLWLLWARHIRRLSRYGFVFWWHLLAALLTGVVFGLVYLQLDLDDQKGIQNFSGSFFYVIVVQILFMAYRTFVFTPRETAIALRERQEYRGGWYHLLCWYFTKIVAELPGLIILSIALFAPVFLLVGIGHGFKMYVYMQIVMVLAGWAAIGLAFLTLGVLRHVTLALIVYAVLLVLFVAFGGLLINVTDIPDWLVWLHYISPIKYAYEAMMKIFWKRVDSIDCDWTLEGCVALTGDGVLKYYSMENRSALGDSLILFAICFDFFFFAFWFLLVLAKKRVSGLQWRYDWAFKGLLGSKQQRAANATVSEKHTVTQTSKGKTQSAALAEGDNYYIHVETPRIGGHGQCDAPPITLGWSSLWLKAQTDKKIESEQQYLLSDASGSTKCGEFVLVTGPSDESNVALLESLGGLQKRMKGKVTLNGVVISAQNVSERTAYVTRDDLFYETLTVEEHLRFQAQLVVGKASSGCGLYCAGDLEIERVEMVLDELELTSKRHMLIRYLSAADTKLLSIATALLVNPSILLAEEPTCGMDFYSSQRVVLKLRQLARGGRTVIVTMKHPSSHLYAQFDTLYLLAGGAAVYHGKVTEVVPYFAALGYQCPQYMSPVDYFVRQVSVRNKDNEAADVQATLFKEAWSTRYSEMCLVDNSEEQETQGGTVASRRRIGCCGQLSLLFRRHILRLARYRVVFGWHAFWMIVLGVIFGLIFLQLDLDDQQDIQNWAGAFFFIIVLQMLVIAYRTFVFLPREMAIAEREHRFGGYYMVCWYLTKVFAELPAMLVLSILLFVPAYLLIGIEHGFKLYFYMQIVMWLAGWSAAGMATLLLGLFRRVQVALIIYMLLLILFVVFGGLLINVDDVPDYLIWLHYISPVKYGYEAMMKLFWGRIAFLACGGGDGSGSGSATFATVGDDYSFNMSGSGSYEDDDGCIAHSGDEVLSHYSMEKRDARSDSFILFELTVLYFFIGYAFLSLRWRRYKNRQQRHSTQNAIN